MTKLVRLKSWFFFGFSSLMICLIPLAIGFQGWQIGQSLQSPGLEPEIKMPDSPSKTRAIALPRSGEKWKQIYASPHFLENIFVISEKEIYRRDLSGQVWSQIRPAGLDSRKILSFSIDSENENRWFLTTTRGILESQDAGLSWSLWKPFQNTPVCRIHASGGQILLAAPHAVFLSEDTFHFKEIFGITYEESAESLSDETENSEISCSVTGLAAEDFHIWIASSQGMFESFNDGKTWRRMNASGMRNLKMEGFVFQSQRLIAASGREIYDYAFGETKWTVLPLPISVPLRSIGVSHDAKKLYALGPDSAFEYTLPDQVKLSNQSMADFHLKSLFRELIHLEPAAGEIRKATEHYANTRNGKIARWQAGSRIQALLPTLSFGKDFSRGNNNDIDRGATNIPDEFIAGPDDIDHGWDLNVSWDLGDFIYSSDQTSIDSREKLMVELRRDLVSEAIRIYYERRQMQLQAVFQPAASELEHLQRLTQIDELTSLLDGLTNGLMTNKLEILYRENPQFLELWEYRPSLVPLAEPPASKDNKKDVHKNTYLHTYKNKVPFS